MNTQEDDRITMPTLILVSLVGCVMWWVALALFGVI